MTAWLDVTEALVAVLPAVPGWASVHMIDGPPQGGDTPLLYCTVGYAEDEDSAGGFDTTGDDSRGSLRLEVGSVRCELVARTGDQDVPALRRQVLGLVGAVADALEEYGPLDGRLPLVVRAGVVADVLPVSTQAGTAVRVPFSISYTART